MTFDPFAGIASGSSVVPPENIDNGKPEPGDPIPAEFRNLNQWVVWRLVQRGTGKPTKLPYRSSDPTTLASSTDSATWSSYDEACRAFADPANQLSGIGFVFTADDPYLGIDFDHVRDPETGDVDPWVFPVTQAITGYLETSFSETGLHLVIRAKFPEGGRHNEEGFGKNGKGKIEVYDRGRYFAFTGKGSNGVQVLTDQQSQFDRQYARLFPDKPKQEFIKSSTPMTMDDATLIRKIESSHQGDKFRKMFHEGEIFDATGQNATDLSLCNILAFWCQGDPVAVDRLFRQSALMREKWDDRRKGTTYGAETVAKACERGTYHDSGYRSDGDIRTGPGNMGRDGSMASGSPGGLEPDQVRGDAGRDRPEVLINPEEHAVNTECIEALARDPELFSQDHDLVRIVYDSTPKYGAKTENPTSPQIVPFDKWGIRERLTKNVLLVKWKRVSRADFYDENEADNHGVDDKPKWVRLPVHPPEWISPAILQRKNWPQIRRISGITEAPTMRADGTIIEQAGYDPASCLFYIRGYEFPTIPDSITRDDAYAAAMMILDSVKDFPFAVIHAEEGDAGDGGIGHKAAFLSALLTPMGRAAITGPCPMFLFDANCPGSGKSKLCDMIANILTGRNIARSGYTEKNEEMAKRLLAIAIGGERMILFDDIQAGTAIGGEAINAVLTGTTIKDRILGKSEMIEKSITTVFYATGNNISPKGDAKRRFIPIRLESMEENPEERRDFSVEGPFLNYVRDRRSDLFVAGMTILRGFVLAGSPQADLVPMDYPEWCGLIRQAIYWAIGVDPCITRKEMVKSDPEVNATRGLLEGWYEVQEHPGSFGKNGLTASQALKILDTKENENRFVKLRDLLVEWSRDGKMPSPNVIAAKMKKIKGRKIGTLTVESHSLSGTQLWKVVDDIPESERPAF